MATPQWFNESVYLRSKLAQLQSEGNTEYTTPEEVKQAIEASGLTSYEHFQQYSLEEKTSASEYFNTYEYLQAKVSQLNADPENTTEWSLDGVVEALQQAGYTNAWDHYDDHGLNEGVNPSNNFDASDYLDAKLAELQESDPEGNWTLPQLIESLQAAELNPVSHFEQYGREEGLTTVPVAEEERVEADPLNPTPEPTDPQWFDEQVYLESKLAQLQESGETEYTNTEQVREAIENAGLTPFEHFSEYSLEEQTSPSTLFNTYEYLQAKLNQLNAETADTSALEADAPIEESPEWTLETLTEALVAAGYTNAWDHFNEHGFQEGVNPSNNFDVSTYMESKLAQIQTDEPDAGWDMEALEQAFSGAGLNAITHFLQYGQQEGLEAAPVPEEERVEPDPLNHGDSGAFTVINDNGQVSFANGEGDITFTLEGTVATFARGEETDADNTVDFSQGPITLNLGEDQTLSAAPADLQGVEVNGKGHGSYRATLDTPISIDDAPQLRQLEAVNLQSVVVGAGLMMSNALEIDRIVNEGSTEGLSVIDVQGEVDLAARNVNAGQNPLDEASWTDSSNFIVRYSEAEAAPTSQRVTLEESNLNLLTVTALDSDENGVPFATSANVEELVIESSGAGPNSIRTFEEGDAGLAASVESVIIEGDQALTVIDLPGSARNIDASQATGNQYLVFNGGEAVEITGGSGDDVIFGGAGDDIIEGGEGNDQLYGRAGADTLTGGEGNDAFFIETDGVAETDADIVTDFSTGENILVFDPTATDVSFSKAEASVESFDEALQAANEAFAAGEGSVGVNAQQVGDNLWVFADTDANGEADSLVQLTGVLLEDFTQQHVQGA